MLEVAEAAFDVEQALEQPAVRTTLMLAMVVIAVNEQVVRTWRKANPVNPDTGNPTDPSTPTTPGSIHNHAGENPAEPLAPDQPLAS